MNLNIPVKINITALRREASSKGVVVDGNFISETLKELGAEVRGEIIDGDKIMVVNGLAYDNIETVFADNTPFANIENFVIDPEDDGDVLDNVSFNENKKTPKKDVVNEKKGGCCPPTKKTPKASPEAEDEGNDRLVAIDDVLNGKSLSESNEVSLDTIIDEVATEAKKTANVSESLSAKALRKARMEKVTSVVGKELGKERMNAILEALDNSRPNLYGDKIIECDGTSKKISEFSVAELTKLIERLDAKIVKLQEKLKLNEGDATLTKRLQNYNTLHTILEDEISYRTALAEQVLPADINEDDEPFSFPSLNPNDDDSSEKKDDEEKKEDKEEKTEGEEKKDDDSEEKDPAEEEEIVELASIAITMTDKAAADDLKDALVKAGIPEDVLEVEQVNDEDALLADDKRDEAHAASAHVGEEEGETSEEGEKTEESATSNGTKLNEDDDTEEEKKDDDATDELEKDLSQDDTELHRVILSDTEYINILFDVLHDDYGYTKEEFEEKIGGTIVEEGDADDKDDENKDDEKDEKSEGDEKKDDDVNVDDLNPDDLFNGL